MKPETAKSTPGDQDHQQQEQTKKKCCAWWYFNGSNMAQGLNYLGVGRGAVVMSNIFLASSFVYLASDQAGCVDEEGELFDDCNNNVYGFRPAALISNIAVIAGLLSAFFMPLFGAIVDCTEHRRFVGMVSAALMIVIQAIQIGTVSGTWYPMLLLQALSGFIYQVQVLATYAYLPEIAREVGQRTMTQHSSTWVNTQFGGQIIFLITVIVVATFGEMDDVLTAQFSQGINTVWSIIFFYVGWSFLPNAPAARELDKGKSLFTDGFSQIFRTVGNINKSYKKGLRWYLLALVFAEAAVNAFTTVSVVFLGDQLNLSGAEIGIFFLVTLLGVFPGTIVSSNVSQRTNPNTSYKLAQVAIIVVATVGAMLLQEGQMAVTFVWGFSVGICLGWFYPAEGLFFSLCLPAGQEAELAGFFVYCTQIMGWLPPLIFSLLVQSDVDQNYGILAVVCFLFPSLACLSMTGKWDEILEEASQNTNTAAAAGQTREADDDEEEEEEGEA